MNGFEIFKFLHVLGAVVWVGAGVGLFLLSVRLRAVGDRGTIVTLGQHSEALGKLLFMPAAFGTLIFGVLMAATEARFSFMDLWILIGFAAVAASFLVGAMLLQRADARLSALAEEFGSDHVDVDRQLGKVLRLNAIDLAILVIAIWAMVAKPML